MENKTPEEILKEWSFYGQIPTRELQAIMEYHFYQYGKQQYNQGVLDCIENAKWKHNGLYNRNAEGTFLSESGISIDTHSMKKLIKQ